MSNNQRYGGIKVNWFEDSDINRNIFLFNFFFSYIWENDPQTLNWM